jgi:hypothetical protein
MGAGDGARTRDSLLGKQGVTELPLAWYRSAVEADQTGVPGIDAALTKAFACLWHKISPTLPEDICKLRA